jgi:hypothetical protein
LFTIIARWGRLPAHSVVAATPVRGAAKVSRDAASNGAAPRAVVSHVTASSAVNSRGVNTPAADSIASVSIGVATRC